MFAESFVHLMKVVLKIFVMNCERQLNLGLRNQMLRHSYYQNIVSGSQ